MLHSDSIREEDEDEDEDEAEREEEEEDDGHLDDRRQRLRHRPPVPQPLSPPPPETPVTPQPPPPPPPPSSEMKAGVDTWDYFFSMDEGMASIAPDDEEIMVEPVLPSPPRPPHSPPPTATSVPLSEEFEEEPRTPEMATPPASLPLKPPKHSSKKKGKGKLKAAHHQHTESAPPVTLVTGGRAGKVVHAEMPRVDLLRVLAEIDERFLKASESAGEVSKALEANRMHYHSNFADNRGQSLDCALIRANFGCFSLPGGGLLCLLLLDL